jgi:hypothetical protein
LRRNNDGAAFGEPYELAYVAVVVVQNVMTLLITGQFDCLTKKYRLLTPVCD